jgi:hypothetical protein
MVRWQPSPVEGNGRTAVGLSVTAHIRRVEAFAGFLGRWPDTATAEDVRRYQMHLTESGAQPPALNRSLSDNQCVL